MFDCLQKVEGVQFNLASKDPNTIIPALHGLSLSFFEVIATNLISVMALERFCGCQEKMCTSFHDTTGNKPGSISNRTLVKDLAVDKLKANN